jgi:hypothetical protein
MQKLKNLNAKTQRRKKRKEKQNLRLLTNLPPFALSEVEGVNGARSITQKTSKINHLTPPYPSTSSGRTEINCHVFIRFWALSAI